jgi:Tol biopolymer transport system component
VGQPAESPAPLAGVLAYSLSPDGSTAAIVQADPTARVYSRSGRIALMPSLGGPSAPVGEGQQPAWSPDGRLLAFARIEGDRATLHVVDAATGAERTVFDSGEHDIHSAFYDVWLSWSPEGNALALVLEEDFSNEHTVWLIPTTGGPAWLVAAHATPALSNPARFSADGHYLAVSEWNRYWSRLTRVYEAATGKEVLSLPAVAGETAWAPVGHTLALSSLEGLTLIAEPGSTRGGTLAGEPCRTALWN